MELDATQINKANEGIDRLIESRAAARERERVWRESERRFLSSREAENRRAWAAYFRHRVALYEDLAQESRRKLGRLIDSGGEARSA